MKNKFFIKINLLLLAIMLVFGINLIVKADEGLQGTSFSKKVIHPENQLTDGEALNLLMKPGQKQKVSVEITNLSDKEIIVESRISGARTNGNGGLEYGPTKLEKDKSMKYDLPDLVKIPSEVKVPAKGKSDLILEIEAPETAYDGIVTGGIQLIQKGAGVESKDAKGATIENKIAFLFGVTLRMSEEDVAPDFELNNVKAGLQNYRNAIFINISNTKSVIAKNLVINTEITKKGKDEVLYQKKKTDISLAPNSKMDFPVTLDGDIMRAGEYTSHVVLKGDDKEWKWDEDFTITDEEADRFNKQDPYLVQERGLDWKIIGIIVICVVVLATVLVIIFKLVKSKTSKKRKKSSKRK